MSAWKRDSIQYLRDMRGKESEKSARQFFFFNMLTSNSILASLFLAPILYTVTLPVLITLVVVNEVLRIIAQSLLWFIHGPGLTLIEDGNDALWQVNPDGETRNILILSVMDRPTTKKFDLDKYADTFEKRVLLHEEVESSWSIFGGRERRYCPYERLKKIVTTRLGYACWKRDDTFNVRQHFSQLPDDKVYTYHDVMTLLSTLTRDMDESKPQWEYIFVSRYQNSKGEEKALMITRQHHAYMDGLSITMLMTCHLADDVDMQLDPVKIKIPFWKKMKKLFYYSNGLLCGPLILLKLLWTMKDKQWVSDSSVQRGQRQVFALTDPIDMSVLKEIRFKSNATIPNVMTHAIIKSVKQVLPADRVMNFFRWSEVTAYMPYKNRDPQNRVTLFSYSVPTQDLTDSVEGFNKAIVKTKRDRLEGMFGPQPLLFYFIQKIGGRFPVSIFAYCFDLCKTSICLTNVPINKERISIFGFYLDEVCGFPPITMKTGMFLSSLGTEDSVKVAGTADVSCLTEEELQKIFLEIPKVIHAMAEYGYIPRMLPELNKTIIQFDEPTEEKVLEEKVEKVEVINEIVSSNSEEAENESLQKELLNEIEEEMDKLLTNGYHHEYDKNDEEEESSMDDGDQQKLLDNKKEVFVNDKNNVNGSAKFNIHKTEVIDQEEEEDGIWQNSDTSGVLYS